MDKVIIQAHHIEAHGGSLLDAISKPLKELLLQADPNAKKIEAYLPHAKLLVAQCGEFDVGVAALLEHDNEYELINLSVASSFQRKGIAKQLINEVQRLAKSQGAATLKVATGNSSLDQLALYQKCGFRIVAVDTNYFADYQPEIYENGIRCLDLIILKVEL